MVTHLMVAPDVWRFGCSSCKAELDKSVIVEVEAEEWYVPAKPIRSKRDSQAERPDNEPHRSGQRAAEAVGTKG